MSTIKYVEDMYRDDYYPTVLVDRVKNLLEQVEAVLKTGETDEQLIQQAFDQAVMGINDLAEAFDEQGSEIETVARESIAETVFQMIDEYNIQTDIEELLRERDW
ncbi:MAG TPA: DUF5713 family protein [Savagea sp.]